MCLLLPLMSPLILLKLIVPILVAGTQRRDHGREEDNGKYDRRADDAGLQDVVELVPADVGSHHEVFRV